MRFHWPFGDSTGTGHVTGILIGTAFTLFRVPSIYMLVAKTRTAAAEAAEEPGAARAYRCLREVPVPLDILVKTRQEVERTRHVPASLIHEVLKRGRVLYG